MNVGMMRHPKRQRELSYSELEALVRRYADDDSRLGRRMHAIHWTRLHERRKQTQAPLRAAMRTAFEGSNGRTVHMRPTGTLTFPRGRSKREPPPT